MPHYTKEIYLLLTYTGTVPSRLIKFYTGKTYSHVSIALDKEFNHLYSFGRWHLRFPLLAGFVKEDPDHGVYAMFKNVTCKVFKLRVTDKQYDTIMTVIDKFNENPKKYRYNFFGILGVMLGRRIPMKDRYFCSEFVAKVLEDGGVDIFNKPSAFVRPDDFNHIESLEEVYEGELKFYRTSLEEQA